MHSDTYRKYGGKSNSQEKENPSRKIERTVSLCFRFPVNLSSWVSTRLGNFGKKAKISKYQNLKILVC